MILCVLIVALGIVAGIEHKSVFVGAIPIAWFAFFVLCLRWVQR